MEELCKIFTPGLNRSSKSRPFLSYLAPTIKLSLTSMLLLMAAVVATAYYPQRSFEFSPQTDQESSNAAGEDISEDPVSSSQAPNNNQQPSITTSLQPYDLVSPSNGAPFGAKVSIPSNWQAFPSGSPNAVCAGDTVSYSAACVWVSSAQGVTIQQFLTVVNGMRSSFPEYALQPVNFAGYPGTMDTWSGTNPDGTKIQYATFAAFDPSGDLYELQIFGENIQSPTMQSIIGSFQITDPGQNMQPPTPPPNQTNQPGSALTPQQQLELQLLAFTTNQANINNSYQTAIRGIWGSDYDRD